MTPILIVDGLVERPLALGYDELYAFAAADQIDDVSRLDSARRGAGVRLSAVLVHAGVKPAAAWLGLHSSRDDFHASIPLAAVRDRGLLIYRLYGQPLPESKGGPVRFLIPDSAACKTHMIDECANVKFVDRIELSAERGFDNRPTDEAEHAKLHERA